MPRPQTKITYQIGTDKIMPQAAILELVSGISARAGGCTTSQKEGWWRVGGEISGVNYPGPLHREFCLNIEVTCNTNKTDFMLEYIKNGIVGCMTKHRIDTDWVHVLVAPVTGTHFSIKKEAENG